MVCGSTIKDMLNIFDCAKVELLQVHLRDTLNMLHVKPVLSKDHTILILFSSDIKTHFRLNIKKCVLCTSSTPKIIIIFISVSQ